MGEIGGLIAGLIVVGFFVLLIATVIGNLLLVGARELFGFFKEASELDETSEDSTYDQKKLDKTLARQKAREFTGDHADRVAADVLAKRAAKRRVRESEDMGPEVDEECDLLAARMAVDA